VLSVEVLTSYSHTAQAAELQLCVNGPRRVVPSAPSASKRPWSLRDHLDEHTRSDMIAAYRAGTTATSLAAAHEVSLRRVKRLLSAAGARRKVRPT
jgi:hypothetical protein